MIKVDLMLLSQSNRLAFAREWERQGLYMDDCLNGCSCVFADPAEWCNTPLNMTNTSYSIKDLVNAYYEQIAKDMIDE